MKKNKLAMLGLAIIIILLLLAIFSPLIAPYEPTVRIKEDSSLGPA
ncbi:MAG: hypothetical protein U5N58_04785 [Actinomycetota bacterium]|nr:hypothetical protein [Actinomycetota bacterium]